jgi:hypothetical protein
MKKIVFIVLFLFSVQALFAFDFGVKVGYNASKLTTNLDSIKSQFKSGFHLGLFARIGGRLYFQPELLYTLQGGVFESNINTNNWKEKVTIGSMDVPLLLGFRIINNDNLNLRIDAGPVASFVVNKSVKEAGGVTGPITTASINNVNWYIHAGAGVDLWFITFDIRYQVGLNKLIQEVSTWDFNSSNNLWVISLGFKIL